MEQLGKQFKAIAGRALERHGLAYADLLAAWDDIIGPELSPHCLPEKYSLPRGEKTGGQLVLRVRYGRSLDFQYRGPQIIERINQFCGFHAVSSLKVLQGALPEPKITPPAMRADPKLDAQLDVELAAIEDERLKLALTKLGREALGRGRKA